MESYQTDLVEISWLDLVYSFVEVCYMILSFTTLILASVAVRFILHENLKIAEVAGLRIVEDIFKDYSSRRSGIVRALTHDVDDFYGLCNPDKDNLCLYGHPIENWQVTLHAEEVPPELPEPALGINFARDGMNRKDWFSLVAVQSDYWLLSVAFYLGAHLNRSESSFRIAS
ncbi:PHD finger protein ALFIN-LIKE 2-like [Rutidosis leptorrhynchoides]|uniref:PHD finger protein ALFIN-LIKE 2-like n=1 Tax=Rutidosis leptorrhynchoides TaxID=125765 RepID=UPI003A99CFDF